MTRSRLRLRFAMAPPIATFLFVVLVWRLAVWWFELPPYLLPGPERVWAVTLEKGATLAMASALTAAGALSGFVCSVVVGLAVALLFSQSRFVRQGVYPYAIFLQTVPIVAIAPLIIIWFGSGFQSVVIVSFIISLFPMITNGTVGLLRVDPGLLELFSVYNASRTQVLFKLRLPHAVPYLVAGAKISSGLSVIGAIVGEFFAGYGTERFGLGYLVMLTSGQLNTAYLFAAVLASTLLGLAVFGAVSVAGDTILARWHSNGR